MGSQEREIESPLLPEDDHSIEKGTCVISEDREKHRLNDYKVEAWR